MSVVTARNAMSQPRWKTRLGGGSDPVEEDEEEDPDDINEVPVEGDVLKRNVVRWGEAAGEDLAEETPEDQQDANGYVHTVKACDDEKRGTVDPVGIKPQAFVMEVGPFVALDTDKCRSEKNRQEEEAEAGFALFDSDLAEVECDTAREEKHGVDRGQKNREVRSACGGPDVIGLPGETVAGQPQHDIGTDQAREEHPLGDQENDHPELAGRGRSGGVFLMRFVGDGCCGHRSFFFKSGCERRTAQDHERKDQCGQEHGKNP